MNVSNKGGYGTVKSGLGKWACVFHVYLGYIVIRNAFLKGGLVRYIMHHNLNAVRKKI